MTRRTGQIRRGQTRKGRARKAGAIFGVPFTIAAVSVVGLISALTGDGWRDALAWGALAVPLIAVVWAMAARRT